MEGFRFKTNIKCSGCLAQVTDTLNETAGDGNWRVDTTTAEKPLTVTGGQASADEIIDAVRNRGFMIERIS